MKRLLSLTLVLMLALALLPGVALAENTIKVEVVNKEFRFSGSDASEQLFTVENISDADLDVVITVYDQADKKVVETMNYTLLKGDAPQMVLASVYKPLTRNGEVNTYSYKIAPSKGSTKYLYYAQKLTITKEGGVETHHYDQFTNTLYPRNTVSSFGPHFRDVTPELTDKWYMFTPIDLTIQGRQTFTLAASNIYEVGEVYVDVNQDTVVVSYHMFHSDKRDFKTETLSEFITFYNSYADVDIVEPEEMTAPSVYAFNQPISILNHFGGDTNVLMFIRNRITYNRFPTPKSEYVRFWENKEEYKTQREHMLAFMDPIMTVEPAK